MTQRRTYCICSWLILGLVQPVAGCRDLAGVTAPTRPPIANAGEDRNFPDEDEVTVTLDGSGSSDPDGTIERYIWLSGNSEPVDGGGIRRTEPDPDNVKKPTVTIGEGQWIFTLWVEDNDGLVSSPDSVVVTVGMPMRELTEREMQCVDNTRDSAAAVFDGAPDECLQCACAARSGEACVEPVEACDEGCWDFAVCRAQLCGDFIGDLEALTQCVRDMCGPVLQHGLKFQSVESCLDPCPDECEFPVL